MLRGRACAQPFDRRPSSTAPSPHELYSSPMPHWLPLTVRLTSYLTLILTPMTFISAVACPIKKKNPAIIGALRYAHLEHFGLSVCRWTADMEEQVPRELSRCLVNKQLRTSFTSATPRSEPTFSFSSKKIPSFVWMSASLCTWCRLEAHELL